MEVKLRSIIPFPIKERVSNESQVWNKEVVFPSQSLIHVLAPSGSGKTTLVHLLYGLRNDYSGELMLGGDSTRNYNKDNWSSERAERVSVVFQDLQLLEELTGLENILLKNQLSNTYQLEEIKEMCGALGILDRVQQKTNTLSRGEKQRVAIIRALCMPFQWIVLDEPFSHLDQENALKAAALIQSAVDENKAGLIMANLHQDSFFNYSLHLKMA